MKHTTETPEAKTKRLLEALSRIEFEAVHLGAEKCPPAPHGCPLCEILYVAREALQDEKPLHPDGTFTYDDIQEWMERG